MIKVLFFKQISETTQEYMGVKEMKPYMVPLIGDHFEVWDVSTSEGSGFCCGRVISRNMSENITIYYE